MKYTIALIVFKVFFRKKVSFFVPHTPSFPNFETYFVPRGMSTFSKLSAFGKSGNKCNFLKVFAKFKTPLILKHYSMHGK